MGHQIIAQPDAGLYAVFSSITDTIVVWDASPEEVTEWFAERAAADARRSISAIIEQLNSDNPIVAMRVYGRHALTWTEALRLDRDHGGEAWEDNTDWLDGDPPK